MRANGIPKKGHIDPGSWARSSCPVSDCVLGLGSLLSCRTLPTTNAMLTIIAEESVSTSANRRVTVRYHSGLHASCEPLAARGKSGLDWRASVKDVSRGGLGLLLDRRFEVGTILTVDLTLDPHS